MTQWWHVTPGGRVRRCYAFDRRKREGRLLAAGCEASSKMGCDLHPNGCPYDGYACGIESREAALKVARGMGIRREEGE